ncbi:MAG: HAD family hydrolase [Bacillota bacterium]|nr:HAD family hydrolase [Bacillota bacterium]
MYKCIIFDVDGTLIDTEEGILSSLQRVVKEELNQVIDLDKLRFALGITGDSALIKLGISNITRASQNWIKYIEDYSHLIKIYDGIEKNLIKLSSAGFYTGIVTSRTVQELNNDFFPLGLQKYMGTIISADDTKKHKPEPDPLLKFLETSGIDASSSLYIGDTIYDMKCANGAVIDFALALWGAKSAEGITAAKYILKSPDEIWDIVNH